MKRMNLPLMSKLPLAGAALLLGALSASALAQSTNQLTAMSAQGQSPPPVRVGGVVITGIPEDWSDRHVVFSDPGTEQEAIWNGRHAQWLSIVNNPRYVLQQMRKNRPVQGPAAADVEARSKSTPGSSTTLSGGAWTPPQSLNGPGLAAGHYPAKYSLSTNTAATCRDFVVFPTGAPGAPGPSGQATIVAFANLYVGGCNPAPAVDWAYNTGGTANLSPVVSIDGEQVAYVQSTTSGPQVVLLKFREGGGGSVTNPTTPTLASSATNYFSSCAAPCYFPIPLLGGGSDSNQAPFYRYDNDTLYVTNDQGQITIVNPVFKGAPNATGPANFNAQPVTSPVYDFASGRLFAKSGGPGGGTVISVLPQVNNANPIASSRVECNSNGFRDSPVVDSSLSLLYAFVGYGCDTATNPAIPANPNHSSTINRFLTTSFTSGSVGTIFNFGNVNGSSSTSTTPLATHGAFDNTYLTGGAGNLYDCVSGVVYQLSNPASISGGGTSTVTTFANLTGSGPNSSAVCSPVTSFQDGSGVDRIFVSVQAAGSCTGGACVFSIPLPSGTPAVSASVAGGTSGIVVDTSSANITGTQQIYFTTINSPSNAMQLRQSNLQ